MSIMEIGGFKVGIMGDPHLGRKFLNGVPLHRRGEREELIWHDFAASLDQPCDVHVCMGDLFDKATVPLAVIMRAAGLYTTAATNYPDRDFVVLKGNHDAGGDGEAVTAFDVFKALVHRLENVRVVDRVPIKIDRFPMLFVPWVRDKSSVEVLEDRDPPLLLEATFGHWDIHRFGNDHNLVPTAWLKGRCPMAITGHDHTPQTVVRDGVVVVGTGSLQPYTHGEDPTGILYHTVTLDRALRMDPETRRGLCLRIVLGPDEAVPNVDDLDCLQLTFQRQGQDDEIEAEAVDLGALDIPAIWTRCMDKHGVDPVLSSQMLEMYRSREIA